MNQKKIPSWLIYLVPLVLIFPELFSFLFSLLLPIIIFAAIYFFTQRKDLVNKLKKNYTSSSEKTKSKGKKNAIDYEKLFNFKNNNSTSNHFTMPTFKLRHGFSLFGILIVAFIIIDGLVSVPAGHVAVIYDRGRGVLEEELPEGLHLKIPFWQTATLMDTRLQSYTMSIAHAEGEIFGDDAIEALTKDGQKINVDVTVQYRILPDNASYIFQNIGLDYKNIIVRPEVRSVIREVVTGYESKSLFNIEPRQQAAQQMEDALKSQYAAKNIDLEALLLRNIQFSASYINAIEEKQIAEQKIQKAEYEKQEAEKIKERKIIEAQAEAEAIRLKGETLKANPQVIQFEFVQKMAPNINWGIMPDGIIPMLNMDNVKGK